MAEKIRTGGARRQHRIRFQFLILFIFLYSMFFAKPAWAKWYGLAKYDDPSNIGVVYDNVSVDKDNSLITITYHTYYNYDRNQYWALSNGDDAGMPTFCVNGAESLIASYSAEQIIDESTYAVDNSGATSSLTKDKYYDSGYWYYIKDPSTNEILGSWRWGGDTTIKLKLNGQISSRITGFCIRFWASCPGKHSDSDCYDDKLVANPSNTTFDLKPYISSIIHTHNTNTRHEDNDGQGINDGYARHYVHTWYSCDANDGYTEDRGEREWKNCYDADNNGYCDFCGRHRLWVNINANSPDGEDTSGETAKFDVSWYDNTGFYDTQNHWSGQVADQPYDYVWVGTQIWIANINIQKPYLYLSGVTGATQSGDKYYYTVQDTYNYAININTAYRSYSLTINPNGGTLDVTDSSITKNSDGTAKATVTYNSSNYYDLGVTASRDHYIMDGFYTDPTGGTKLWNNGGACLNGNSYWNSNNQWCYVGDVTVYAHWLDEPGYHDGVPIVYTITYTLYPKNGANIVITDPGNPTAYTIETPTFTLNNPSATNYSFEGWYGSGTNGSKGVTIVQGSIGDLHFEADWLPTKDPNKSSGKDQTVPYVKTTPIIENKVRFAA